MELVHLSENEDVKYVNTSLNAISSTQRTDAQFTRVVSSPPNSSLNIQSVTSDMETSSAVENITLIDTIALQSRTSSNDFDSLLLK
jgi:hypothetical protein